MVDAARELALESALSWPLSDGAKRYVRETFEQEGPSRAVGEVAPKNLITEFQSKKNGETRHLESVTNELPFALSLEFDSDVLYYICQPQPVQVTSHDKNGKARVSRYTPDVFIIYRSKAPVVVEVKSQDELESLVLEKNRDWKKAESSYEYTPAKSAFGSLGLSFEVAPIQRKDRLRANNQKTLLELVRQSDESQKDVYDLLLGALPREGAISLYDFKTDLGLENSEPILRMIIAGILHTDLSRWLLTEERTVLVAATQSALNAAIRELEEADNLDSLVGEKFKVSINDAPPHKQVLKGLENLKRISNGEESRSVRRWRAAIRSAPEGATDLSIVTPRSYRSGNRKSKLPASVETLLGAFLDGSVDLIYGEKGSRQLTKKIGDTRTAHYLEYRSLALSLHPNWRPVTNKTFRRRRKKISAQVLAYLRGGKRLANKHQSPSDVDSRNITATRPFEVGTCDHYLCDIFIVLFIANGVRYAMRPWLTILRDVATKEVLSFWISFQKPSRRSIAMLLRRCVAAWGRLPESIIVDNGSEFHSVYMSALAAAHQVNVIYRPSAHGRYGSEAEGFFGEIKNLLLKHLEGFVHQIKDLRAISSSHNPENLAVIDARAFFGGLQEYVESSNNRLVGTDTESRRAKFDRLLKIAPYSGRPVKMSQLFRIETAVDAKDYKKTEQGVHLRGMHFWAEEMNDQRFAKDRLEVRNEPENPYVIYVRIGGDWVTASTGKRLAFDLKDQTAQEIEASTVFGGDLARAAANDDSLSGNFDLIHRIRNETSPQAAQSTPASGAVSAKPVIDVDAVLREQTTVEMSMWKRARG